MALKDGDLTFTSSLNFVTKQLRIIGYSWQSSPLKDRDHSTGADVHRGLSENPLEAQKQTQTKLMQALHRNYNYVNTS